jgi:siroheme synthase (precorrin-2 oxidase/ferrochelatase)
LLDQNCRIIVITNRINRFLSNLQSQQKISVIKSRLTGVIANLDNFNNAYLVIAATNNKILNHALVDRGRQMHAFVYASDDPQYSDSFTY